MAILVCGGAGYIGSHAVAELLSRNEDVVIIDNLQTGHEEAALKGASFYNGDLRDEAFLRKVFQENDIEAVMHFAADSLVGESVTDPLKYYDNNVYGACLPVKGHERVRCEANCFLINRCNIRRTGSGADYGNRSDGSDKPVRGNEACH